MVNIETLALIKTTMIIISKKMKMMIKITNKIRMIILFIAWTRIKITSTRKRKRRERNQRKRRRRQLTLNKTTIKITNMLIRTRMSIGGYEVL